MNTSKISQVIGAIYARYSDDKQKATSIDDQIRRARDVAAAHGITIPDELIFIDEGISAKGGLARPGFEAMLRTMAEGAFAYLFADSMSRLSRNKMESAIFEQAIDRADVRAITADGLDTSIPGWQLIYDIKSAIAANELKQTAFLVRRGMEGAILRGNIVSAAPYGYNRVPQFDSTGKKLGTLMTINPDTAKVVRRIFAERLAGKAYDHIAGGLIADGIPAPRGGLWSASSITNILTNSTYTGVLSMGASRVTKYRIATGKAKKVKPVESFRPELTIIERSLFQAVSPSQEGLGRGTKRGGGKHWCAGILKCHCGRTMSVKNSGGTGISLYCSQCAHDARRGLEADVPYISASILRELLKQSASAILTPEVVALFHSRLEARLSGGVEAELSAAKARLVSAEKALQRLAVAVASIDDDAQQEGFLRQISVKSEERKIAAAEISRIEAGLAASNPDDIKRQMAVDPRSLLPQLFDNAPAPQLRALLERLFPALVFEGRKQACKRESTFSVTVSPGVAAALLTGTATLDDEGCTRRFLVLSSSRKDIAPNILPLAADGTIEAAAGLMCRTCNQEKPLSEFPADYVRRARCKACGTAHVKQWKEKKKAATA